MNALKRALAAIGLRSASPGATTPGKAAERPGFAAPGRRQPLWLAYCLPFITTAVTLLVVEGAARGEPVNAPVVVFVLPILLSAYAGGLVPGLLSTVLCTLATVYFVLPPTHSWSVASPVDNIKWITLAAAGTLISFLMGQRERPGTEPLAQHSRPAGSLLLSAQRRVQAGFAVLLTCLIAIAAVSYPMLVRLREDAGWVEHTHQAIATLRLLMSSLTDAETGARGYIITDKEEFLEPYHSARLRASRALTEVRSLTRDNPVQQRRLDWLEPLVAERLANLSESIALRNNGSSPARAFISSGLGTQLDELIRAAITEMDATEQGLLAEREKLEKRASRLAKTLVLGGSALAVLIAVAALWMIGKAFEASRDAESALQESRDQLEIRVKERTSELRTSEQRMAGIIKSAMDAVIMVDEGQRIVLFNPTAEKLFGCNAAEVLGHPLERFIPQRFRTAHARHVLLFGQSGLAHKPMSERAEICGLRADGTEFPIEASISQAQLEEKKVFTVILRDITERKRAEEILRERAALLELAHDSIMVREMDGTIRFWNRGAVEMYGYSPGEAVGKVSHDLLRTVFPQPLAEIKADLMREGRWEGELRHTCRDGTLIVVASRWALQPENARSPRVMEINNDITQRKRAEEALRQRAEELETIMNVVPVAIWVAHDPHCHDITGNPMANQMYEAREGENVTARPPPGEPVPPRRFFRDGRELAAEELPMQVAAAQGIGVKGANLDVLLPSGKNVNMYGYASPLRDAAGEVRGCVGAFLDITERTRAEEAIRRSEAELREAQRIAQVGSWTWEVAPDLVTWSQEVYRIFGRDPALPAPSVAESAELFTPESWARLRAAQQETLERGTPYLLDLEVVRADGTRGWMIARGETERNGSGQVTKLRGTTQDITDRKNAEQALARRTQELERSNADLAQFAYVASHDLKEPLRAVSGCVGLLKGHYEGKLDEQSGEYMTHIVDGAARMETLIDGLLAYSRVGTRGGELQPVEGAKALGTALQNLAAAIEESGAVVTCDALPTVRGDAQQLGSLFQNLIGNALKFRREAPPRIHVSAERNGTHWRFSVRDNGIGIAPQYFERIFGVFQRLHTRREYPGTGIGLALCKKIVERHGGRIWVESVPGEGATFYFGLLDAQTKHRQHGGEFHA